MITEIFDQTLFSIPADMILCSVAPGGLTDEAIEAGFNRVHPEISTLVHQANNANDVEPGVLLPLKAENTVREQYLVAVPVSPHVREPLSPFFVRRAFGSLRKLINDLQVKKIVIPIACFCELEPNAAGGIQGKVVTKHMLMRELMQLESVISKDVTFLLVHNE